MEVYTIESVHYNIEAIHYTQLNIVQAYVMASTIVYGHSILRDPSFTCIYMYMPFVNYPKRERDCFIPY